ncbi:MAG: YigZ family protein [Bacteroidetes bacterium HGW-Bacteroidetes-10]|nr:MAG: YigZ family protein [Bacteroidetes bacterium HGW-Bacteroidetes-10]
MSEINSSDTYKSISKPSTGIYKELGSKFLSFAFPVSSEEEIKDLLAEIRKSHFDARHHCYAYRLGASGELWRANDDGEPSSSGGKPILGQLLSYGLSDILIIVVRYFGGTKLGVPGLIRAYRSAAADSIENGEVIEKIAGDDVTFTFGYLQMNDVMKLTREFAPLVKEQNFDNLCRMKVNIRLRDKLRFIDALSATDGVSLEDY